MWQVGPVLVIDLSKEQAKGLDGLSQTAEHFYKEGQSGANRCASSITTSAFRLFWNDRIEDLVIKRLLAGDATSR